MEVVVMALGFLLCLGVGAVWEIIVERGEVEYERNWRRMMKKYRKEVGLGKKVSSNFGLEKKAGL